MKGRASELVTHNTDDELAPKIGRKLTAARSAKQEPLSLKQRRDVLDRIQKSIWAASMDESLNHTRAQFGRHA